VADLPIRSVSLIVGPPTSVAPGEGVPPDLLEKIRNENLNVYRASPQRLREDVGQESQIAQDYFVLPARRHENRDGERECERDEESDDE